MGKLTDIELRNWIKAGRPVSKADGVGLTFTLSAKGTAAWILRYRIAGQRKELTMGRYPELSLADARREALAQRQRIANGCDVASIKAASKKANGLRREIAELESELQRYEITISSIRARLEVLRKIEGGNHGQAD